MITVFSSQGQSSLGFALNIAEHHFDVVDEDFTYCVDRERAKEILTLRELGLPYVVLCSLGASPGKGDPDGIVDTNVDLASLPDSTRIIMRADKRVTLPACLQRFQPLLSKEHNSAVMNWSLSAKENERFFKRSVDQLTHRDFSDFLAEGFIATPIFIKGVEKGNSAFSLHHVFGSDEEIRSMFSTAAVAREKYPSLAARLEGVDDDLIVVISKADDWFCPYRDSMQAGRTDIFVPKDGLILSDVLDIKRDGEVKCEYRAFVVNGEVTSLSAYVDFVSVTVPDAVREFATDFAIVNADMAPAFVADFGMTDRGIVLIEMNDFSNSGRYLDNDPVALYKALYANADLACVRYVEPMPIPEDAMEEENFNFLFSDGDVELSLDGERPLKGFDLEP